MTWQKEHTIEAQPVPLSMDEGGVLRVSGTRVSLDTLVEAFEEGLTAEEIVQQYPALSLADVYSVIGYYLNHQEEVTNYLQERKAFRQKVRLENERRFDPTGVRARLLARKARLQEQ